MTEATPSLTSNELAQILPADPKREAIDTIRGYDWQRWLTVQHWLELAGEDSLWIEWAEDFTTEKNGQIHTVQAKNLNSSLSLAQQAVREIISKGLQRDPAVRTIVWTSAQAGYEKGHPFDEPGILHWNKVAEGLTDPDKLRDFLLVEGRLTVEANAIVSSTPKEQFPQLIKRILWVVDEPGIEKLRERILPLVERRLASLGISNPSVLRDTSANMLFTFAAQIGVRGDRTQRRLNRIDLDHQLLHHNLTAIAAAAPSMQQAFSKPQAQPEILEALQRDLAQRFKQANQRSYFPEVKGISELTTLAREVLDNKFDEISPTLRREILLRAARASALHKMADDAKMFLDAAVKLNCPPSELAASARVVAVSGDPDQAIRMLRDEKDADNRSTLLTLIAQYKGDDTALEWLTENALAPEDLSDGGLVAVSNLYLRKEDFCEPLKWLDVASDERCSDTPYLYFFRGAVRFASTLIKSDRPIVLRGLPLDARVKAGMPDEELGPPLDTAISDLNKVQPIARNLDLREAYRIATCYVRWCELVHPGRRQSALEKLRHDMGVAKTALPYVQFAFAYDRDFDPLALSRVLERREQLGGLDDEELRAAFVIQLHSTHHRDTADFIAKHRARLEADYDGANVRSIEIQALVKAGETKSARLLLDQNSKNFSRDVQLMLSAMVAGAEGADPIAEYQRVFDATDSTDALASLLEALVAKKDRLGIATYAELLFGRTGNPDHIVMAARSLANANDTINFLRITQSHPIVEELEPSLSLYRAWAMFTRGATQEAEALVERVRVNRPELRDLNLETNIAIETGKWERLGEILDSYLEMINSGPELIRAAQIAQASDQGSIKSLLLRAVECSPDDPAVLVTAYTLALETGLESDIPQIGNWFHRALDLSGPDGPVKRFELKDLLTQQNSWSTYVRSIGDAVGKGALPLLAAAPGLRTTLIDIVLQNFARNTAIDNPLKRIAVPLFSGRRLRVSVADPHVVAIDISAVMTMGWLGVLPRVIDAYPQIFIPAGVLSELFEGRARLRQFQKSRLDNARELNQAIRTNRLKVLPKSSGDNELNGKVGVELAVLIHAARKNQGAVVRPAPIPMPGLLDEYADTSELGDILTDTHQLLDALILSAPITQSDTTEAKRYLDIQDQKWPNAVNLSADVPLYLDGLAVSYLQTTKLLQRVLDAFARVYVASSVVEEADSILEQETFTNETLKIIDRIRNVICDHDRANKIVFGAHADEFQNGNANLRSSSINLISDLGAVDFVVLDDRALNKDYFASDKSGRRAKVLTTLDIIDDLAAKNLVDTEERWNLRHKLRLAGAILVPIDAEELVRAAFRSGDAESEELRLIRENIGLTRIGATTLFPGEVPWFASISRIIRSVTTSIWARAESIEQARKLANWIYDLWPQPDDWVACWTDSPPSNWGDAITQVMIASLLLPIEIDDNERRLAYHDWLETLLLTRLRLTSPEAYEKIINQARALIASIAESADG